jgi:uncharacterized protein YeaO (DUF488 family)
MITQEEFVAFEKRIMEQMQKMDDEIRKLRDTIRTSTVLSNINTAKQK